MTKREQSYIYYVNKVVLSIFTSKIAHVHKHTHLFTLYSIEHMRIQKHTCIDFHTHSRNVRKRNLVHNNVLRDSQKYKTNL